MHYFWCRHTAGRCKETGARYKASYRYTNICYRDGPLSLRVEQWVQEEEKIEKKNGEFILFILLDASINRQISPLLFYPKRRFFLIDSLNINECALSIIYSKFED